MIFPGVPATTDAYKSTTPITAPAAKAVTMELYSASSAERDSTASVAVPEGLKTASPVKMSIDSTDLTPDTVAADAARAAATSFTSKSYWGSAETVPPGQPKVTPAGTVPQPTEAAKSPVPALAALPSASFAYWPTGNTRSVSGKVPRAEGTYTLTTSFTGGTTVTLEKEQGFLHSVELAGLRHKNDFAKPIKITWSPVANALAYVVTADGGTKDVTITWTSSSNPDAVAGVQTRPFTKEEVASNIEKGIFLSEKTTTCIIPAGIFAGTDSAFLTVTAIGTDKIQETDGIQTRVIVRSIVSAPLAGASYKPAAGMEDKPEEGK